MKWASDSPRAYLFLVVSFNHDGACRDGPNMCGQRETKTHAHKTTTPHGS
eukprot:m.17897 g.17897  ORF g.17897 m.17897 type:complete len:50 (-) comp3544_c0_seq1:52-201(-)